jgi:hypothetical protein
MKLFWLKLRTSARAVLRVLAVPSYGLLAAALAAVTLWVLLWFFNLNLLWTVWSSPQVNWFDKLSLPLAGFQSLVTNFDSWPAAIVGLFAVLSGINLALLVFVLRYRGRGATLATGSKNLGGLIAAIIGSGCAACGSSVLTPLATALGASLSAATATALGIEADVIGIGLVLISLHGLGQQAATLLASGQVKR